jgi:LmbE family N-acetylglucosaminyl deacetylase
VFVVQPHLDDAVLGIGQKMLEASDRGEPSRLVTMFAGSPKPYPPLVLRPHDERCGFHEADDVMAVRREEDRAAVLGQLNGWVMSHMDLLDEQYTDERRGKSEIAGVQAALEGEWLDAGQPQEVWCPVAVNHPDHTWCRVQTTQFALPRGLQLRAWFEPGYRTFYKEQAHRAEALIAGLQAQPVPWPMAQRKLKLIECYESQLSGISALAVADALQLEVWGTWGGRAV